MPVNIDRRPVNVRLWDYYTAEEAREWLNSPHPQLEGRTAIDVMLRDEDGNEKVHEILDRLESGGYL